MLLCDICKKEEAPKHNEKIAFGLDLCDTCANKIYNHTQELTTQYLDEQKLEPIATQNIKKVVPLGVELEPQETIPNPKPIPEPIIEIPDIETPIETKPQETIPDIEPPVEIKEEPKPKSFSVNLTENMDMGDKT